MTLTSTSEKTEVSDCLEEWNGDEVCNDECNIVEHDFDGGDCCSPVSDKSSCDKCECLEKQDLEQGLVSGIP